MTRWRTILGLLRHLARRERALLIPLVIVLLLAGTLLVLTSGAGAVAPLTYTLF